MFAKRKVRSETSSDSSSSPEEKRSREAQNESILSETDDEVLEALEMAEDVGKKIDLILAKLSKLDNIESRLENVFEVIANIEESVANLDREVKELKRKSKKVDKTVEELETSVTFNGEDITDLKRDVKAAQLENENLTKEMLYQEHYSRRENLLFVGIGEENPQLSRDDDRSQCFQFSSLYDTPLYWNLTSIFSKTIACNSEQKCCWGQDGQLHELLREAMKNES